MAHALVKLEVSQKQAYIFSSNKLKDNVLNSAVIAWIMSPEYFAETVTANGKSELFDLKKNLVYSGGGHTRSVLIIMKMYVRIQLIIVGILTQTVAKVFRIRLMVMQTEMMLRIRFERLLRYVEAIQ